MNKGQMYTEAVFDKIDKNLMISLKNSGKVRYIFMLTNNDVALIMGDNTQVNWGSVEELSPGDMAFSALVQGY